jgi:hypothetical protein
MPVTVHYQKDDSLRAILSAGDDDRLEDQLRPMYREMN